MSSFEKHYAGLDITSSDNNGKMRPVSRVTLYVDDKNVITAGDDTGLEISAECPNATQAIANTLLARFKGFQYQAMSADDANIDPAFELGDSITADGMYSVIARISDDGSGYVSVSAPGEEELEDEYPMDGPLTRAITQATDRKIADTRSSITKTAEEIRLEVQQTYATKTALGETETRLNSSITQTATSIKSEVSATYATKEALSSTETNLSSSITQTADSITSEVKATYATKGELGSAQETLSSKIEQTAESITSTVNGLSGQVSSIDQRVNNIKLSVSGGLGGSASITLSGGGEGGGTIDLSQVRSAFANDQTAITIGAGTVTFNSNTFVVNSTYFGVTADGTMTAKAGIIGGWALSDVAIYNGIAYAGQKQTLSTGMGLMGYGLAFWAGDGKFQVNTDGWLHAENADISGTITATSGSFTGKVNATSGTIGGWTIDDHRIYGGSTGNVMAMILPDQNREYVFSVGSDSVSSPATGKFRVKKDGTAYATKFTLSGKSVANGITLSGTNTNSGTISGGTISKPTISGSTLSGTTTNTGATITGGTYSSGTVSYGTISHGTLSSSTGGTYVGTCSGSTLSSCTTGGTSLAIGSNGSVTTTEYGNVTVKGTSVAELSAANAWLEIGGGVSGSSCLIYANTQVNKNLTCLGEKKRVIETKNYGYRGLHAFETPLPTFSDYGTACLDETGVFHIVIDPIFAETVNDTYLPTVFLTKYGEGDIWVERVEHDVVKVRGTPGLEFAWETRYAQANAEIERMQVMDFDYQDMSTAHDFQGDAAIAYEHSKSNIDYAQMGYEYYTDFERSLSA